MPKAIEDKLKKEAVEKRLKGKAKNRYIYGTLKKIESGEKAKAINNYIKR